MLSKSIVSLSLITGLINVVYLNVGSCLVSDNEKVKIQLAYESLCPYCVNFLTTEFKEVVTSLESYIDVHPYPYGNAATHIDENGTVTFECQHGPEECYGNMLHACAIDSLKNITAAVIYDACLMDDSLSNGMSDDKAADQCGQYLNVDASAIKTCAKGAKGTELHKYYGEESKKAGFVRGVPFILVNGVQTYARNFKNDVCGAIKNPPSPCPQNSQN